MSRPEDRKAAGGARAETYGSIQGQADAVWRAIEQRHRLAPGAITGISTGVRKLDLLIDGLRPETLTIIGARPKQGKTALLLSIIRNLARQGIACALFSLEMPAPQIIGRLIAMEAEVDFSAMMRGLYNEDEELRISAAAFEVDRWPIFIDEASGLKPSELAARAQRAVGEDGCRAVFVDYLQRLRPERNGGSRYEDVTSVSMALADLRKPLKAPIVAAAQLNRKLVDRGTTNFETLKKQAAELTRPSDGDLRDSGQLEQDGDAVIFLNRPIVALEKLRPEGGDKERFDLWDDACSKWRKRAELSVHFNRAGPAGFVDLIFDAPQMAFREIK